MSYDIQTILFATDLGPRSGEVLKHAVGIAQRFGAQLHLLTVMSAASQGSMVSLDNYLPEEAIPKLREGALQRIRDNIDQLLAEAGLAGEAGVVSSVQILEGHAAEIVLAEAARLRTGLIVLGSHGHSALGKMLLGSVAHQVIVQSRVPVMLVPLQG